MLRNWFKGLALTALPLLVAGILAGPALAAPAEADKDTHGWLGVVLMAKVTSHEEDGGETRSESRIEVLKVMDDSPAATAGIEAGDVIVAVDGRRIDDVGSCIDLIRDRSPGETVSLTVERGGLEQTYSVTLGERPAKLKHRFARKFKFGPKHHGLMILGGGPKVRLGVKVQGLSDDLREYFGASEGEGVLVSEVIEGSPAEAAGLRAGDVIVAIDGKTVKSHRSLTKGLEDLEPGDTTRLRLLRKGSELNLDVQVEKRPGYVDCEGDEDCDALHWDKHGFLNLEGLGEHLKALDDLDLDIDVDLGDLDEMLTVSPGHVVVGDPEDGPCSVEVKEDGDHRKVHVECQGLTKTIELKRPMVGKPGHEVRALVEAPGDGV